MKCVTCNSELPAGRSVCDACAKRVGVFEAPSARAKGATDDLFNRREPELRLLKRSDMRIYGGMGKGKRSK
jgi:hypothetical protein